MSGFAYDLNGNPTTYKGNALTFDAENRMTAYGSVMTARYRADNLRAWKQSSPGRFYYYYIGGNPYLETNASGVPQVAHIFAPDGLVARGLGSSWVSFDFDPQGNVLHRYAVNGTIFTTSSNTAYGAFASWGTGTAPWGYNAKWCYYYDWETGLYYCQNRYYDPAVGRWLTRDPIGFAGGMNVYGYAGSGPVGTADATGLKGGLLTSVGPEDMAYLVEEGLMAAPKPISPIVNPLAPILAWLRPIGVAVGILSAESTSDSDSSPLRKYVYPNVDVTRTRRRGDPLIYRSPGSWESTRRLHLSASKAEAKGFGYGVSGSYVPPPWTDSYSCTPRSGLEAAGFPVIDTGSDPNHVTILLPKPVNDVWGGLFNAIFGRLP